MPVLPVTPPALLVSNVPPASRVKEEVSVPVTIPLAPAVILPPSDTVRVPELPRSIVPFKVIVTLLFAIHSSVIVKVLDELTVRGPDKSSVPIVTGPATVSRLPLDVEQLVAVNV